MQTSYSQNPPIGRVGMVADTRVMRHIKSRLADSFIQAGRGVFRVPGYGQGGETRVADPGQVYQLTAETVAADVDAFLAGGASAAGIQTITSFNGTLAATDLHPARKATLVLSNHADWDATTAVLRYINQDGQTVEENMAIPNGGNATVTTTGFVRRVLRLVIPAQSGAGGTFTLGMAALDASVTIGDFMGVAVYDAAHTPALDTGVSDTSAEYGQGDSVPVMERGPIWVQTEDACSEGGAVFVRVATGTPGTFRSDADGGAAVEIPNAKWGRTSGVGGLNIVELW